MHQHVIMIHFKFKDISLSNLFCIEIPRLIDVLLYYLKMVIKRLPSSTDSKLSCIVHVWSQERLYTGNNLFGSKVF